MKAGNAAFNAAVFILVAAGSWSGVAHASDGRECRHPLDGSCDPRDVILVRPEEIGHLCDRSITIVHQRHPRLGFSRIICVRKKRTRRRDDC